MIDCQIKVKTDGTQYISATKQLEFFWQNTPNRIVRDIDVG